MGRVLLRPKACPYEMGTLYRSQRQVRCGRLQTFPRYEVLADMRRMLFFVLGIVSLGLGAAGLFLPLVPTVPFLLLATFCFAQSSPRLERWIVEHERFGPHILAWRRSRAVSLSGKRAAWAAFGLSATAGLILLPFPWALLPAAVAVAGSWWIAGLPTAPPVEREQHDGD